MAAREMTVKQEGDVLVIRLPMQEPTPSSSGKTMVVATTHGNVVTNIKVDGKPVKIGINAFVK